MQLKLPKLTLTKPGQFQPRARRQRSVKSKPSPHPTQNQPTSFLTMKQMSHDMGGARARSVNRSKRVQTESNSMAISLDHGPGMGFRKILECLSIKNSIPTTT